jgi:two-component system cell cycle sensor histidine kinase/response regulator CckA
MDVEEKKEKRIAKLRAEAEDRLARGSWEDAKKEEATPENLDHLYHELQVHQIELQMQNEELRNALAELEKLRDKYFELYHSAPVGYVVLDERGFIQDANLTAVHLFRAELTGLAYAPLSRFVSHDATKEFHLYLRRVFNSYAAESCEIRFTRPDGTSFYAQLQSTPVIDENGQRATCRTAVIDITDRINAQRDAAETLSMLNSLFDNAAEGICVWHNIESYPFVKFSHWNKKMTEYTGYTMDEINRLGWYQTMYPDPDLQTKAIEAMRVMGQGNDLRGEEWEIMTKDGMRRPVSISTSVLKDQAGTVHVLAIMQDLTERKKLEAQLVHAKKMEAMGTLAAGIAHDFNNMLQVILGYAEVLLMGKKKGDPEYAEIQAIIKMCYDARDLVQKIRVVSKKADIQRIPIDLNRNIEEVLKGFADTLPKEITIDAVLADDLAVIIADAGLMNQMVTHLVTNACEAMPRGGTVTIETKNIMGDDDFCEKHGGLKPGPYVMLRVSDTGRGIQQAMLERIFDPFYSTKPRDYRRGTGLGLALVHGIVEQHKGYIHVESEVGKGTTFRVYLPAEEAVDETKVVEALPTPPGGTETILLVEDEEILRTFGKDVLENFGYKVLAVADGVEALEVYSREKADIALVILDIIMPRMDGKQCLKELLKMNPSLKVLISSGVVEDDLIQSVVALGARGSLLKPFAVTEMLEKVRQVLDAD